MFGLLKNLFGKADNMLEQYNQPTYEKIWWDIYRGKAPWIKPKIKSLPIAVISTAYLSQLVINELKFELPDEYLNKRAKQFLIPKLGAIIQKALVGGFSVIKPYITNNGHICFDFGYPYNFKAIEFNETGAVTEGVFIDKTVENKKAYIRMEHHKFTDGINTVENKVYLSGTNREVKLSEVARWSKLLPRGEIPIDNPLICTIRTPYDNNLEPTSPRPISMFANCSKTLEQIDIAHTAYCGEMKKAEAKVFGDKTIMTKQGLVDDFFITFQRDPNNNINNQLMTYSPNVREEEYRAAINTQLRLYEIETGISSGTFTFDGSKGMVTATQVLSEDRTTFHTVKQMQNQLQYMLLSLSEATAHIADYYGISVNRGEPVIEFGDSVFEDTGTEFTRRMQMVSAGILKPEKLLEWYYGVPEAAAREMMPEMTSLFN